MEFSNEKRKDIEIICINIVFKGNYVYMSGFAVR